jgi:hypothetical protein
VSGEHTVESYRPGSPVASAPWSRLRVWRRRSPVRARERESDGPPLLDGGPCPSVPHDPGHDRASGGGFHPAPASRVPPASHRGEMREQGGGRRTARGRRWSSDLGGHGQRLGSGAHSFKATRLPQAAGESDAPARLGKIVRVVHHTEDSTALREALFRRLVGWLSSACSGTLASRGSWRRRHHPGRRPSERYAALD